MTGFSVSVGAWAKQGMAKVDSLRRAATIEVFGRVIERTPVGNPDLWDRDPPPGYVGGQARGGWRCGVGRAPDSVERIDPDGAAARAEVSATVAASAPDEVVMLRSSLPYIYRLEYGWSSQAPGGMVRLAAAEVAKLIRQQREKLKRTPAT